MKTLIIIMGAMMFGLIVLLAYLRTEEEAEENRMIQQYITSMEQMYQLIRTKTDTMRGYRHDLEKHIRTMSVIAKQEQEVEYPEIHQYSERLQQECHKLDEPRFCEDEIVNAIVSIKKQQCEEKKIPFKVEIRDRIYDGIQRTDMTAILYNLLDNALEANEKIQGIAQQGIWLQMGSTGEEIWIEVKNKVSESTFIEDGKRMFESTKEKESVHGLGTKIIQKYIEKYKGSREIMYDKEAHLLSIRITLKRKADLDT